MLYVAPADPAARPYLEIDRGLRARGYPVIALEPGMRRDPAEFINAGHLNERGAKRFSALLADELAVRWPDLRIAVVAMIFSSATFFVFFIAVMAIYALARTTSQRATILLVASLIFYASWKPIYLLLLGASLGVNYLIYNRLLAAPSRPVLAFGHYGQSPGARSVQVSRNAAGNVSFDRLCARSGSGSRACPRG